MLFNHSMTLYTSENSTLSNGDKDRPRYGNVRFHDNQVIEHCSGCTAGFIQEAAVQRHQKSYSPGAVPTSNQTKFGSYFSRKFVAYVKRTLNNAAFNCNALLEQAHYLFVFCHFIQCSVFLDILMIKRS